MKDSIIRWLIIAVHSDPDASVFNHGFREGVLLGETRQLLYQACVELGEALVLARQTVSRLEAYGESSERFWKVPQNALEIEAESAK